MDATDPAHYPCPPLGDLYDIGGYRLHLRSMGDHGPTVVMDAGLGATSLIYETLLPRVSAFARAVSFDRAGYAWSDPAPRYVPRTSRQIAQELHHLLQAAQIPPPYVLVGNSFGAINVLWYAQLYPDEVAGLLLVDPIHPHILSRLPRVPSTDLIARAAGWMGAWARRGWMRHLLPHLRDFLFAGWQQLPEEAWSAQECFSCEECHYDAMRREAEAGAESLESLAEIGYDVGDIPLCVLVAGELWAGAKRPWYISQQQRDAFHALMEDFAAHSRRGHVRVVPYGHHTLQADVPGIVTTAIQDVIIAGSIPVRDHASHDLVA